jgi:cytochrome c
MTRKNLVAVAGGFAAVLIGLFLLARVHPFGDPALFAGERGTDIQSVSSLPGNVQTVLLNKCVDCHGRGVRTPLYGHFAPASWLMERDVTRARSAFDLSKWAEYSADRQDAVRSHIAFEARKGTMPPLQYVAIHRSALRMLPMLAGLATRCGVRPCSRRDARVAMR